MAKKKNCEASRHNSFQNSPLVALAIAICASSLNVTTPQKPRCQNPIMDSVVRATKHPKPDIMGLRRTMKAYTAIIEQCPDTGFYVGYVPGFPGAHSQAASLDELNANLKEVIEMLLEDGEPPIQGQFVGTQTVTLP